MCNLITLCIFYFLINVNFLKSHCLKITMAWQALLPDWSVGVGVLLRGHDCLWWSGAGGRACGSHRGEWCHSACPQEANSRPCWGMSNFSMLYSAFFSSLFFIVCFLVFSKSFAKCQASDPFVSTQNVGVISREYIYECY